MESDECQFSSTPILVFWQIELNLYSCYPLFPLCFKKIIYSFYRSMFHSFLTTAICIYLCSAENVLFQFLIFGFISHAIRILVTTHFQKVSSKRYRFRNNIFPLYKLKCFAMSIRWQRNFCSLEKILDFGKDFLLKNFCLKLLVVQKIKWFIQHEAFVFHDLISNSPFKVL